MKRRFALFLCTVLLFNCCGLKAFAAEAATQASPAQMARGSGNLPKQPYFLSGTEIVWRAFPRKPALGSSIDLCDLLTTLSIQASRTEEQKNEAARDKDYSIKLVTDVIAPDFETKYPMTFEVLKHVDLDGYIINSMIKKANARLRPFVQHPALVQPLFTAEDFSYPSGHSSGTELQARVLGTLFPAQSEQLLNRARQVADSRVIAGVHYNTDTLAGIALGDLIFNQLQAKAKFRHELSAAAEKDGIPTKEASIH
jgi:acid phosphatase (class A)